MTDRNKVVSVTRDVTPAFDLCATGRYALDKAQTTKEGSFLELLTAVLMAALTFEAFLNQAGLRVWGGESAIWRAIERRHPMAKLEAIEEQVGFRLDPGQRPLQTVATVCRLRNDIVHARPRHFEAEIPESVAAETPMLAGVKEVSPEWEMACTREFAQKALDDVTEVAEAVSERIGMTNPLHFGGMTMRSG